jgi:hypothetical protein
MNEEHSYTDQEGLAWKRVYQVPNASVDAQIDPYSNNSFLDATKNKKGTYGDLLNKSAELSEKRAKDHGGVDPVKKKFLSDYSKRRKGAKHPSEKKTYESGRVKVEY